MKKQIVLIFSVFWVMILLSSCSNFNEFVEGIVSDGCIHDFDDWVDIEKSTCIVQGERQRKCSKCKKTKTEKLALAEHDYIDVGSIPECGSNTTFLAQICINCNHIKSSVENGNVVHPHSFVRREPQTPTCQQQGIKIWFECQNCGYDVMETENALGHISGKEIFQDSSNQTFHYRVCQRDGCNQRIYEFHKYSWTITKRSTCTEAGTMKGVCGDCGYSCTKNTSFEHQYDTGKIIKDPTCTNTGIRTHTCTVCGSKKSVDVLPLGCDFHNYQLTNSIENLCEHKGICIRCGKENYETIHNEGEWYLTNNANNKCEFSKECNRCHKTAYKTEHAFDEGKIISEPTCAEKGNKKYTCQRCNFTKDMVLSELGHDYEKTDYLESTCIADGFTIYRCRRCQNERLQTNAMYGHNIRYLYDENDHWRQCSICHEIFTKHSAHSFNTKVKEEVNAEKTSYTYILYEYCEFCGYERKVDEIAHKHTGAKIIHVVSPTCIEDGYLPGLKCSVVGCGEVFIQPEPVKALGHNYIEGVCTRCGEGRVSEGLRFTLSSDGSYYILSGIGSCKDQHIVIPSEYENKPVKAIAKNAFYYGNSDYTEQELLSITIPSSIEEIGYQAFCNCKTIINVRFTANSKLKIIGENAFYGCTSLQSIEIPASVTSVGKAAFYKCEDLASVIFVEGGELTYISEMMFQDCSSLESIVIPSQIETLQYQAFDACTNLTHVIFAGDSKLTNIGKNAFYDCTSLRSIEIPASVTSVGKGAFYNCKGLTEVTFAEECKLTYISEMMFQNCSSLESIVIPNHIQSLHIQAFDKCTNLTYVIFEENSKLASICENAFYNCTSLRSIEIPASVTSVGKGAFYNCKGLTEVTFAEECKLTYISEMMFQNCSSLESIVIPAHIESLNAQAFCQCTKLTQVIFAENSKLTSISERVFYGCTSLQSIEIPANITSVGKGAFYNCKGLTEVTFEEECKLTYISEMMFQYCESLETITLHDNITSIGMQAFCKCNNLKTIKFNGTVMQWSRVSKDDSWNSNTGNYTVNCTDGNTF